ncbi:type VI secretion system tip protein VgrG [Photobacterium galatheae]|uniref:Uncharacterized protein n=2 Tax=Photobacterium galatheae TaxID=1654360 RepID=A0A066RRK7_9GAMM|nr:type VI secretion system tip protein TssI/VgrG [Photobacterium galatheae]KDM90033.1 hypothetical protein EA58_19015 [Photobacterium galatheae]MCM0150011.1 type VI secretion system tip protein VgrG [Photobacterium galatheae]
MSHPVQFSFSIEKSEHEFRVESFEIKERLFQPFEMKVSLLSRDADNSLDDLVRQAGVLKLFGQGRDVSRLFHGVIREVRFLGTGRQFSRYELILVPDLWFLEQRSDCRIFQDLTINEIIESVLEEAGVTSYRMLAEVGEKQEYILQYRETDLDFIHRLMSQHGLWYFFDHTETGHELVILDKNELVSELPSTPENATLVPNAELHTILFHGDAGGVPDREHIFEADFAARTHSGAVSQTDYHYLTPNTCLMASAADFEAENTYIDLAIYHHPGRYQQQPQGKLQSDYRLSALKITGTELKATSCVMRLIPGYSFVMEGHPRQSLNRDFILLAVEHKGHDPQAHAEENNGEPTTYHNQIIAFPVELTYRAAALPAPRVEGPQTAVVVGPANEEIYTDNLGRVKVQFHWDRLGGMDEHSTCWVRVSQTLAGPSWGAVILPRIGHEVVVTFLEGDPDRPLVTGAVYHALHQPPYPLPEHKTKTVLRTQTHQGTGFNEISFEDEANQEEMYFHAQKNMRTTVLNDRFTAIGQDEERIVGHQQTNEILGNQREVIGGNKTSLAQQTFVEDVAKDVVTTYNANESVNIAQDQTRKVLGHQTSKVGKDDRLEISENQMTTVHASRNLNIGGNHGFNVDSQFALSVGKNVTVTSDGQTTIISADEIQLLTGASGIVLKSDGKILLSGLNMTLDGADKLNIQGGNVKINPGQETPLHTDIPVAAAVLAQFNDETHLLESTYAIEHLQGLTTVFDREKFAMWLSGVFGYNIPPEAYLGLFEDLQNGAFENPPIEVTLGNIAFYDNRQQTIFVGKGLIQDAIESQDQQSKGKLLAILVHEFGHHIDYSLRNVYSTVGGDAMLDEGAAFAAILGNLNMRKQSSTLIAQYTGSLGSQSISLEYPALHAALKEQRNYIENDQKSQNGDREYFSAGGTAEQALKGKYGHQSVELVLLEYFTEHEIKAIYYGNWLRDYSQVVDPKVLDLNLNLLIQPAVETDLGLDKLRNELSSYLKSIAETTESLKKSAIQGLNTARVYTQRFSDDLSDFADDVSGRLFGYSETLKQQNEILEKKRSDLEKTKDNLSADGVKSRMNIEHAIESNRQHQELMESLQAKVKAGNTQQKSASQSTQAGLDKSSQEISQLETEKFFAEQEKHIPEAQQKIQALEDHIDSAFNATKEIAAKEVDDPSGLTGGGKTIGSKGISHEALTQIVEILARKEFPMLFAQEDNSPYRLTPEKLGAYLPKEHLDNPRGVTAPENPEYANIFRGDYQAIEGEIDSEKWYKNYFKQSIEYAKSQLRLAVSLGKTAEGLIHFGQALHVMEDIFAHSNFVELALNRILKELPGLSEDERRHVNDWVQAVPVQSADQTTQNIRPLTTGVFGASDTLVSLLSVIEKTKDHSPEVKEAHFQTQLSIALILMQDYAPNTVEMIYDAFGLDYSSEDERKTAEQALENAKKLDELSYDFRGTYHAVMEAMFGFINRLTALLARQAMEAMKNAQDDSPTTDPTHTQLAKDPDDHPLHTIAAEAAREMVRTFGETMSEVWDGEENSNMLLSLVDDFFVHPEHISPKSPGHIQNVYHVIAEWAASSPVQLNQARSYQGHLKHEYLKLKQLAELNDYQLKFTTDLMKKVNL